MKKRVIVSSIIILALSFLFHGVYDLIPSVLTSIIFPVNESIWEHGKLILISFFVFALIDKYFWSKKDNLIWSNVVASIICIGLTYLIFTPIFLYVLKTNDNIVITILIYALCILASVFVREKYIDNTAGISNDRFGVLLFLIIYIIYGILTYRPIHISIFYDYKNGQYGIIEK